MNPPKITLALVDDHQLVIEGLKSLLEGSDQFEVVAECTDPFRMLQLLETVPVNILLTDVMMPEMNGAQLAKAVASKYPAIKILVLSMSGQGELVNDMIHDANISGYVLKNIGKKELIAALEKIAAGGIYFSEEVLGEINRAAVVKQQNIAAHLTSRELEIIKLIEKEYNNKLIADTLFLSERTVETHRKNIFRKTKTNSVVGLVKYAYVHKLT